MTVGYDEALAQAATLYPGVRVGHPGRGGAWWVMRPAGLLLRARLVIDAAGAEQVAPGPAIIVSNHRSGWDPVATVVATGWRVSAFTKAEWFEGPSGAAFRWLGQIPLRRGDDVSTEWALDMASRALAEGRKVGVYPEGTRGPDEGTLYRLHERVLVPLLVANPDVPVHAVTVRYAPQGRRTRVTIRVSERLAIDPRTMSGSEMTAVVRDRMVELGGLRATNQSAFVAKARASREQQGTG